MAWTDANKVTLGYGFTLWAAGLLCWIGFRPDMQLRTQLMHWSPFFFWLGFVAIGFGILWSWQDLRKFLSSFSRKEWLIVAGLALFALLLTRGVAPRTHRILYDEDLYEEIGLNLAHNNLAATSHDGVWEFGRFNERRPDYNKQPNAWPFLINLAFRVFGVSENVAFSLDNALFMASVVLIFLCGALLFNSSAGIFAALIYALIPENIIWYSCNAVEPSAACFGLLAVTSALLYVRSRSSGLLFLTLSLTAFAVQFRPEAMLMAGVVILILGIEGEGILGQPLFARCFLVFAVLLMGHLVHLYSVSGESWGSQGSKLGISYVLKNFLANGAYYVSDRRFPILFSLLAVWGIADKPRTRWILYPALWFLAYWGIFLFFYAGSYEFGADVRFSVLTFAPLALLGGRGTVLLMERIQQAWRGVNALGVVLFFFGLSLALKLPLVRAVGEEAWQSRADHDAAQSMAEEIPADGFIMTQDPCMFHMWGKNAAQLFLFKNDPNYVNQMIMPRFHDRLYLHWGYWCNTNAPGERAYAEFVLANYRTTLVTERRIREVRYALYKIEEPRPSVMIGPMAPPAVNIR